MTPPPESVQAADPQARRWAVAVLVALIALGLGVRLLFDHVLADIEAQGMHDPEAAQARLETMLRLLLHSMALGVLVLAGNLAWIAHRVRRSGRYPPPGVAMLRSTPVRTGAAARRRATIGFAAAGALLLLAVTLAAMTEGVLAALGQG